MKTVKVLTRTTVVLSSIDQDHVIFYKTIYKILTSVFYQSVNRYFTKFVAEILTFDLHSVSRELYFHMFERCPYSELFWSIFFRIRTEYEEILRISP